MYISYFAIVLFMSNIYFSFMLHKIQYGGGPKLSHEDCCLDCLKEGAQNVMSADTYRDRRESFKQLAWDILDGKNEDGKYYVS
jgi:ubiquitin carboxyl-terminal hydrolase 48